MQDSGRAWHLVTHNRGKEPIIPNEANALVDDELSLGSSPPLGLSPTNDTRAKSRKRTLNRLAFSYAISGVSCRARREVGKGQYQPDRALDSLSVFPTGAIPSIPFVHPAFGRGPTFDMPPTAPIQGPTTCSSRP